MLARLSLCVALLLSCARWAIADPATPSGLRGVLSVRSFEFPTAVAFRGASHVQLSQRGYVLAIEVDETLFAAQSAPARQIFVDQTAAVYVAGPLGPSAHSYVLVLVPAVDLSQARLWLGSRVFVGEQSAMSISAQELSARSHGATLAIHRESQGPVLHSVAEVTALAQSSVSGPTVNTRSPLFKVPRAE